MALASAHCRLHAAMQHFARQPLYRGHRLGAARFNSPARPLASAITLPMSCCSDWKFKGSVATSRQSAQSLIRSFRPRCYRFGWAPINSSASTANQRAWRHTIIAVSHVFTLRSVNGAGERESSLVW